MFLTAACCGPKSATCIFDDDGSRVRRLEIYREPQPPEERSRSIELDHCGSIGDAVDIASRESSYNPASMSEAELAALLDLDCEQPVVDEFRRFKRTIWAIQTVDDANGNPIVRHRIASCRLPIVGESRGYSMPDPILSPEFSRFTDCNYVMGFGALERFLDSMRNSLEPRPADQLPADRLRAYVARLS